VEGRRRARAAPARQPDDTREDRGSAFPRSRGAGAGSRDRAARPDEDPGADRGTDRQGSRARTPAEADREARERSRQDRSAHQQPELRQGAGERAGAGTLTGREAAQGSRRSPRAALPDSSALTLAGAAN